jgi:peptide/nickel transport system substrate-binding protein
LKFFVYIGGGTKSLSKSLRICLYLAVAWLAVSCGKAGDNAVEQDTLRVAMSSFSDGTFLPWNGSSGRKPYLDTIYEYLVYLDPDTGELRPGLAERWVSAADASSVTLWLRKGVPFQRDWGEVTASDVKYTLDRIMDRSSITGIASTFRFLIREVSVIDTHVVRIDLNQPDIDFVSGYLSNGVNAAIVSRKYLETVGDDVANREPVGSGPFELESYREDTSIDLRAVNSGNGHWRVMPEFGRIRFLSVPEEFTRAAMLKAGEVDIAPINYDSIDSLERSGLRMIYVEGNWAPVIRFGGLSQRFPDTDVPWQKRAVRQAMNYAVDKEAIVRYILHDEALIVPGDFTAREWRDLEPYPYDPDKARELLTQAGYPQGFDMTLRTFTASPGAELPVIAEAVAGYWRDVGIRTSIVPTTWTSLRTAWSSGKARDIAWTHRGLAFSSTLQGLIASSHSSNLFATFSNDTTDSAIEAIGRELDRQRRAERIRALGEYLRDEAASVFIGFANEPYGISERVGDWPTLSEQGTNVDLVTRNTH